MLNQIEKQFEGFITAMYGKNTISRAQEKDIEKSFYAGMLVSYKMILELNSNEEVALKELEKLSKQILDKSKELLGV